MDMDTLAGDSNCSMLGMIGYRTRWYTMGVEWGSSFGFIRNPPLNGQVFAAAAADVDVGVIVGTRPSNMFAFLLAQCPSQSF